MKNVQKIFVAALLSMVGFTAMAQQVNTLYFLENAPMRHTINPAFMPVSNGYVNFTPLGYSSFSMGMPLTPADLIYTNKDGKLITALYSIETQEKMLKAMRRSNFTYADMNLGLLNFGFRVKEKGYFNFDLMLHMEMGMTFPKPEYLLGTKPSSTAYNMKISRLGLGLDSYVDFGFGYAHQINDQWTVGGKLKILLGMAYADISTNKNAAIKMSTDAIDINLDADAVVGAPIKLDNLPEKIVVKDLIDGKYPEFNFDKLSLNDLVIPAGAGAALDLGVTYKPIKQLQITAAINDLGFIYWMGGRKYKTEGAIHFDGIDSLKVSDFQNNTYADVIKKEVLNEVENVTIAGTKKGFARMVTAKLNVGVDANFWDNRIGVGILSQTRFYNNKVYEEVTIGGALRPVNWFNLAVSYSLVENGKYSNIGAGLSFMPYDGINLTLAMDYIPTHYAHIYNDGKPIFGGVDIPVPNHMKGFNLAMGFSIVWGTNAGRKDKDKDGVKNMFDVCPNTPKNVKVDKIGCPLDTDGDGVPDYLDECPGTPMAAYGLTDEKGCPIDTDGDGVPDYKDECPGTPESAYGMVDEKGCALDSDGDGVPDYLDECPGTPIEAAGHVDEKGCVLDTDGDGVPDYIDQCPNTPEAAFNALDSLGCPLDTDGDGVPDYLDECPNTPLEAAGHVDEKGCELDTDGDGVPDWKDDCPEIAGVAYNKGCPEVKKEVRNLLKKAMQGIQFESGNAIIKKASYPLLDQIAKTFIDNPDFIIEVQGHTDDSGKYDLNKKLSDDRAHAVRDYLIKAGVDGNRMTAIGFGPDVPVADNRTSAGRAKNRRVEFNITFEEVHTETVLEHIDTTLYQQHLDSIQPVALPVDSTNNGAAPQE